jgi:hypothetical protein
MEPATPVKPMGKFRASYLLAVESFELFRKDREIVWYMIWDAVAVVILTVLFFAALVGLVMTDPGPLPGEAGQVSTQLEMLGYVAMFVFYVGAAFITTYFSVALTHVVAGRIAGEDRSYGDGIRAASARIKKIFVWSLLSATVGIVLKLISNKGGLAGRLFSMFGGVAWSVATFFIVPVLTLENEEVGASVKRSSQTFVKTWGETLITNFSLGIIFMGLYLVVTVCSLVLGYFFADNFLMLGVVGTLMVLSFVILTIMQKLLDTVMRVVLYHYALYGKVSDSFTPELIIGALKKDPKQQIAT